MKFQCRKLDASGTHLAEPSLSWTEEAYSCEEATDEENWPFRNVPWQQQGVVTHTSVSNMVDGVHQDRGLTEPMQSMVDLTDVGMEREDHGPTMSTECQVSVRAA